LKLLSRVDLMIVSIGLLVIRECDVHPALSAARANWSCDSPRLLP
jgi:hypothetical protein